MMTIHEKILLVDDDPDHLSLVEKYSAALGIDFIAVSSALDAVRSLQENNIGAMVTDLVMPIMDGMELLKHPKAHHPGVEVLCHDRL